MLKGNPNNIKIYHIVHIDKLSSILDSEALFSDSEVIARKLAGTTIGMTRIKERRLGTSLSSHPDLKVGECVPFYFCPRSPMLYMFDKNNHVDIQYHDGQEPVIHLVIDMRKAIQWANQNKLRWAFTDSNAGSSYFNDYCNVDDIDKLDWNAINTTYWSGVQDKKMAEFLIENAVHWSLVEEIGVYSFEYYDKVKRILAPEGNNPPVVIKKHWYY